MAQNLFTVPSVIENISTRKDGTMKIVVGTQELDADQMAILMSIHNKLGYFLFSLNDIERDVIPEGNAPSFKEDKTPSQRLRDALYVYWKKCTDQKTPFDAFYHAWIGKKIDAIKATIPKS